MVWKVKAKTIKTHFAWLPTKLSVNGESFIIWLQRYYSYTVINLTQNTTTVMYFFTESDAKESLYGPPSI